MEPVDGGGDKSKVGLVLAADPYKERTAVGFMGDFRVVKRADKCV